jgi:hybrid cluster-associated redox disulfide protein
MAHPDRIRGGPQTTSLPTGEENMDRYTKGFIVASLFYFFIAAVLGIWMGEISYPEWLRFVHVHFNLLGFMTMMVYGVGYFILPRFNGKPLYWPNWLPIHFYLANIGLIGLAVTAAGRPSLAFSLFALINIISVAMFAINIGATILTPEKDEEPLPAAPTEPEIEITPDTRMAEIINNWPELVELLIKNGFTPLADPGHLEKIKSMPVTLGMACERHGLDVEMLASLLTKGAQSLAREKFPAASGPQPLQSVAAIAGTLKEGEAITHRHIIGDILKIYPATQKVFKKYYGSACFSCPGQATENIRQSAMIHNVDENKILAELNEAVQEEN